MRSMILVRHAMPKLVPDVPSSEWDLHREGRRAAMALGDSLPLVMPTVLSSAEPKAAQTAQAIAAGRAGETEVMIDERLDEVARPQVWDEGYVHTASRYLEGEAIEGWEDHHAAVARFEDALRAAQSEEMQARVVVSHGILMSLWLAPRVDARPLTIWQSLTFPDAWRYDTVTNRVMRLER